jgi:hypothetical protein
MSLHLCSAKSATHQQQAVLSTSFDKNTDDEESDATPALVMEMEKAVAYDFGFGLLSLLALEARPVKGHSEGRKGVVNRLKLSFLPPYWLSRTAFLVNIDIPGQCIFTNKGLRVSLQLTTVNQSPELLEAIYNFDPLSPRQLFESGQARPTDTVMDLTINKPITLLEVNLL